MSEANLAVVAVRVALLLDGDVLGIMVAVEIGKARSGAEEATGSKKGGHASG